MISGLFIVAVAASLRHCGISRILSNFNRLADRFRPLEKTGESGRLQLTPYPQVGSLPGDAGDASGDAVQKFRVAISSRAAAVANLMAPRRNGAMYLGGFVVEVRPWLIR